MTRYTADLAANIIHDATIPGGILASSEDVSNYKRVWSRDSVITGIAGLLAKDETIIEGLKHSLQTLASTQAKQGNIPSNVSFDDKGTVQKVSYGGLCGRVDSNTWWIIGLGLLSKNSEKNYIKIYENQVLNCLSLLQAWEFNNKGFIYTPQSGNWADEYITSGYTLYDQLLYLWALRLTGKFLNNPTFQNKAEKLEQMIKDNFWIEEGIQEHLYHPNAFHRLLENGAKPYWIASLTPGGYIDKFDLLANSLCVLLGVSNVKQSAAMFDFASKISTFRELGLFPSFFPVIKEKDPEWFLLESNYAYEFRNYPYEFHNAGIWPAFNGWFGTALALNGQIGQAKALLNSIEQANSAEENGFYECHHGQTGQSHGTKKCTWSAAGQLMLYSIIEKSDFSLFKNE